MCQSLIAEFMVSTLDEGRTTGCNVQVVYKHGILARIEVTVRPAHPHAPAFTPSAPVTVMLFCLS
jgi:hypothetical protein